jgi:hypothetical protein
MKHVFVALLVLVSSACLSGQTQGTTDTVNAQPPVQSDEIIIKDLPAAQPILPEPIKPVAKQRTDRKSIKRAFFMSLAIPGAGEYYVGARRYTAGFLTAEGLIWGFALVSKFQGEMWRSDYRNFAAQQAGANYGRDDDNYYRDIYEYPNSDWFNEDQWRQAREQYPNDPQAQAAFVAGRLYTAADGWRWATEDDWNRYRSLRVKSRKTLQRISYAAGSALLNHLLSAVNAARLARSYNFRHARKTAAIDWRLDLGRDESAYQLRLVGNF